MYRVDHNSAIANLPAPTPPTATPDRYFFGGNDATGQLATLVEDEWLNMLQEEICNAVLGAGLILNKGNRAQLFQAMTILASMGHQGLYLPLAGGVVTGPTYFRGNAGGRALILDGVGGGGGLFTTSLEASSADFRAGGQVIIRGSDRLVLSAAANEYAIMSCNVGAYQWWIGGAANSAAFQLTRRGAGTFMSVDPNSGAAWFSSTVSTGGTMQAGYLYSTGNIAAAGTMSAPNIQASSAIWPTVGVSDFLLQGSWQHRTIQFSGGNILFRADILFGYEWWWGGRIASLSAGGDFQANGQIAAGSNLQTAGPVYVGTSGGYDFVLHRNGSARQIDFGGAGATFQFNGANHFRWLRGGLSIMSVQLTSPYYVATRGWVEWQTNPTIAELRAARTPVQHGLDDICQCEPVCDEKTHMYGLVPAEARPHIPECFRDAPELADKDDPRPITFNPMALLMLYMKAFKEVDARLRALEGAKT